MVLSHLRVRGPEKHVSMVLVPSCEHWQFGTGCMEAGAGSCGGVIPWSVSPKTEYKPFSGWVASLAWPHLGL